MADVVLNSGKTGRIERAFDTEGELYAYIRAWCDQHNESLDITVTLGTSDLLCFTHGYTYRIQCEPGSGGIVGEIGLHYVSG